MKEKIYEPVNLGNPNPIRMIDLATEIIAMTNSKSEVVFQPLPSDDPLTREPDCGKAKAHLDWEPLINRKVGLEKTIEYFAKELISQTDASK